MKNINEMYLNALKRELKPVMGCTEPASAALAGALSRDLLGSTPDKIVVFASRDVIKNVMGVGIPHSTHTGLASAVLLGVLYGNPSHGLNILSQISNDSQQEISSFIEEEKIKVILTQNVPSIYIKVDCEYKDESASVTIANEHDMIVEKVSHGKVIIKENIRKDLQKNDSSNMDQWNLQSIFDVVQSITLEECGYLIEMARMNNVIGVDGLHNSFGLNVGRIAQKGAQKRIETLAEAYQYASALCAAASDARMSGSIHPVVINSGSGNQGITAFLPPFVLGEFLEASDETLMRALALSNLIAIYLAHFKGRLSALCGAFTAAIGASCAYVYLLGGTFNHIESAINLMIANLSGVICDGAKKTCALKIYSCVQSASLSAQLALSGNSINEGVGIIDKNVLNTLRNLQKMCVEGMEETDKSVLSIMLHRHTSW